MQLYPPQQVEVDRALAQPRPLRWIYNAETGLGKTPMALETLRREGAARILVVCPASVREAWIQRIAEWWPERAPDVGVVFMRRDTKTGSKATLAARDEAYAKPVQIVSYELLKEVRGDGWDAIVFDEAHFLQSPRAKWSQRAALLSGLNPSATILELTATLAPDRPKQAWNLLATLWPKEWGKATNGGDPNFRFQQRYCLPVPNEYATTGFSYEGVNPETAPELAARIAAVSSRLTRVQMRDYLPSCDVHPMYLDHRDRRDDVAVATEWLTSATQEATHCGVFTYHIEAANMLALELGKKFKNVVVVTGEEDPKLRARVLDAFRGLPNGVLVASMKAVGIGISLTCIHRFLVVEWISSPGLLMQFLGRFQRLDSAVPAHGHFLVRKGTEQENYAYRVALKIKAINQVVKAGASEEQLGQLFSTDLTDEQFASETAALMDSWVDQTLLDDDEDDT